MAYISLTVFELQQYYIATSFLMIKNYLGKGSYGNYHELFYVTLDFELPTQPRTDLLQVEVGEHQENGL